MGLATERDPSIEFGGGKVRVYTRQRSIMQILAKHPEARMVQVEVDRDLIVTAGTWRLPNEFVHITLTGGEAEIPFQLSGKKR